MDPEVKITEYAHYDNKAEKNMIFISAFMSDKDLCAQVFKEMKTRNVYTIEMRNHYHSYSVGESFDSMSYDEMVEDLIKFADKMGLQKFTLMGLCFGGRVAMLAASKYPERIENLIVFEAALGSINIGFLDDMLRIMNSIMDREITLEQCIEETKTMGGIAPAIHYYLDMTKEKDAKVSWRHNYGHIRKCYDTQLKTMEPYFTYTGPVFVLMAEKTEMAYDVEDFKKVFPNFV